LEKNQSTEIYTYHTISLDLLVTQVLASKTSTKRKKLRNTGSLMNFSVPFSIPAWPDYTCFSLLLFLTSNGFSFP